MCRLPVTLGGGLTSVNGCASGRSGRNRPPCSQCVYHLASMAAGSKVLASSLVMSGSAFASVVRRGQPRVLRVDAGGDRPLTPIQGREKGRAGVGVGWGFASVEPFVLPQQRFV